MSDEKILQMLARHDERLNQHDKQIDCIRDLTKGIYALTENVKNLAREVKEGNFAVTEIRQEMNERFKEQGERIGALEAKPGKEAQKTKETAWVAIITAIVCFVVTAVATYAWANMGLH